MPAVGDNPVSSSANAEALPNITISSDPAALTKHGEVTVSVTIANTNPGNGGEDNAAANPTDPPAPSAEPAPSSEPEPTPKPVPEKGAYTDIRIENEYGAAFNTSDISASESKTFKGRMYVTDSMIGVPLTFTVSWKDWRDPQNGVSNTRKLTLTIARGDTVYLKASRIVGRMSAAPGQTVTITYTLVNTGTITLNEIELVDKEIAGRRAMLKPFSLASGESRVYEYTYVMGEATVNSKPTVTFVPEGGAAPLSVTIKELTIGLYNPRLAKEITQGIPTPEGAPFTMYFTNIGNRLLNGLVVTDELNNRILGPFNLAFGETKYIEYTVPNPKNVRNVVFKISGTVEGGGAFRDHTEAYAVMPYIDPAALGLDFTVKVRSQLDSSNMIGLTFTITNTGSVDYSKITVIEETLNYELYRADKLTPQDGSAVFDVDLNVGDIGTNDRGERELAFILTALDASENQHTYSARLNASYYDPQSVIPNVPPDENDPTVVKDPQISAKLDKLITAVGEKMNSWFNILFIVAITVACITVILLIVETVLRKKIKAQNMRRKRNG